MVPPRAAISAGGVISNRPPPRRRRESKAPALAGGPRLDFGGGERVFRTRGGNQPACVDRNAFTGWVRPMSVCGLDAAELKIECGSPPMDLGRDAYRSERTERDARLVGADYYYAVFQVAGRSVMTQNDEAVQL